MVRRSLKRERSSGLTLATLPTGQEAVLESIDLPAALANRLMELGFVPGTRVSAPFAAPGGDPRVYRVDGAEVALRRETAQHLRLQPPEERTP